MKSRFWLMISELLVKLLVIKGGSNYVGKDIYLHT